ncbi:MAG UNVERIFIED_CONTAM: ester cyclase [Anaerolineae bacterium]|jgi:predicted ester cyclase
MTQAYDTHKALIDAMYHGLNQNVLGLMQQFWFEDMVWEGPAGIGTMNGIDEFEYDYRKAFIHAFPDKSAHDIVRVEEGDWVAGTGFQTTTFAHDWLGIPATGQPIKVRYMDFWRVEERDGEKKLAENLVLIDILGVLEQAGYNVNNVLKFVGSKPPQFFDEAVQAMETNHDGE